MTGDPTKQAELRELLINFISQNSHVFREVGPLETIP